MYIYFRLFSIIRKISSKKYRKDLDLLVGEIKYDIGKKIDQQKNNCEKISVGMKVENSIKK